MLHIHLCSKKYRVRRDHSFSQRRETATSATLVVVLPSIQQVDGGFLAELRESDLMDSIGMEHQLHLKKLMWARQKLTPLTSAEVSMASSVRREESATSTREGIPDTGTAFSQVRTCRLRCCLRLMARHSSARVVVRTTMKRLVALW